MSSSEPIAFSKFHGLGNDFVIIDCSALVGAQRWLPASDCKAICDRNFGIGADGVIMYAAIDENVSSLYRISSDTVTSLPSPAQDLFLRDANRER